jgi:peroxiredoxin
MLPLGTSAPDFKLPDTVSGTLVSLSDIAGEKGTLVMFICNHCPFVLHVNDQLVKLANDYLPKGFGFVAISSIDVVHYPQDSPELMKQQAQKLKYPFPYLYDESQEVAKAYDAACTPDFFLFNSELKLVYRGELDDSRPGNNIPVTGKELREAMNAILENRKINPNQIPSMGCNIKWKV